MRSAAGLTLSMIAGLVGSTALASPIKIVQGLAGLATVAPQTVLFHSGDLAVVRESEASDADFRDLYVVNMGSRLAAPSVGETLYFSPARLAVMRLDGPQAAALAGTLHKEGLACGLLFKLNGDSVALTDAATPMPIIPADTKDERVSQLSAAVVQDNIAATITELAAIPTRFHDTDTGGGIAPLLAQKYEALRAGRSDVTVTVYDHGDATPQKSLVVRIEGSTRPDELIVLGSHLDSVNWQDGSGERAPGADDNASGTATNLEVFRVLMAAGIHPQRTIEIHAYAAEEVGLVGSQDIARTYRERGTNVVAMMQYDMDLYNPPGEADKIWLVTNNANAGFNAQLEQLITSYVGLSWGSEYLSGGTSDHTSWYRSGYATAFPFEHPSNYNHHIHSAEDTVANSGAFGLAAGFARLGAVYLAHFAGIN